MGKMRSVKLGDVYIGQIGVGRVCVCVCVCVWQTRARGFALMESTPLSIETFISSVFIPGA